MLSSRRENGYAPMIVNWTNYKVGLQSAITACGGLEAMDTHNIPKDETLYIEFLRTVQLPETISRLALIGRMLRSR